MKIDIILLAHLLVHCSQNYFLLEMLELKMLSHSIAL